MTERNLEFFLGYPIFAVFAGVLVYQFYQEGNIYWSWWIAPSALSFLLLVVPGTISYRQFKKLVHSIRITPDKSKIFISTNALFPKPEKAYQIRGIKMKENFDNIDTYTITVAAEDGKLEKLNIFMPAESSEEAIIPYRRLLSDILLDNQKEVLKYRYSHNNPYSN